jgi:hypothetical protein
MQLFKKHRELSRKFAAEFPELKKLTAERKAKIMKKAFKIYLERTS